MIHSTNQCLLLKLVMLVVFIVCMVGIALSVMTKPSTNGVVLFNKGRAVTEFARQLNKYNVPDEKQSFLIKKFLSAMDDALYDESTKNNLTIISSKYVIAGGRDITNIMLPIIAKKIKSLHVDKKGRNQ